MRSKITGNILSGGHSYPRLMVSPNGTVVLFSALGVGTVVHVGDPQYTLGYHTTAWDMGMFSQFSGTVSLGDEP